MKPSKISNIILAIMFLSSNTLAVVSAPPTTVCVQKDEVRYDLIGDISGKKVYRQIEKSYECTTTKTEQGPCTDLRTVVTETNASKNTHKIAYEEEDMSGALGQMLGMLSATNKVNSIFSGWKGYCIDGVNEDFDWMGDPYMWAGLALSAVTAGADGGAGTAAADTAKEEAQKRIVGAMVCTAQAGLDIGAMYAEDDDVPCDPVDEFCEESASGEEMVYSLSTAEYGDFMADNNGTAKLVVKISESGGTVKFKLKMPEVDDTKDMKETEKAAKEAKETMMKLKAAIIALVVAACYAKVAVTGSASGTSANSGGESIVSVEALATTAGSLVGNAICGPLCGAAGALVAKLATSFDPVDSCGKEEDAKAEGVRHESTFQFRELGNCMHIRDECVIDDKVGSGCQLKGEHYCCFDQKISMVLIKQIKAQLALDWKHCTGVTWAMFNHINFTTCTPTQKLNGVDGTTLPWDATKAEREGAYQYIEKCMDFTEFIQVVTEQSGAEIDAGDIQRSIDDMKIK